MTQKLAWLTDIHLEMVAQSRLDALLREIRNHDVDALLIGGDIADANTLGLHLLKIADALKIPMYFVLGNHDYYGADIPQVRHTAKLLTDKNPYLFWLPQTGVVELSTTTALVGHGGWSDGGYGNFMQSEIMLNDYVHIKSLITDDKAERLAKLKNLGEDAADCLRPLLEKALNDYEHVYVLTHSPPFIEACWYEGKTPALDDAYLPHFTCKVIGDLLLEVATTHPDKTITVLCGHTHGSGTAQIRPNLEVITGGAEYENPLIQQIITVS
ncbi:MAG: metallophosphoesterase [Aggregatilineales bacterium]